MPYKDPEAHRGEANARKREKRRNDRIAAGLPIGKGTGRKARGPGHPRWNGGRSKDKHGYPLLQVGRTHRPSDPNGYVRVNVLVMCAAIGRSLHVGEVVHHRNGIIEDNRLENLQLMTNAEHNALHNRERGRDDNGRFLPRRPQGGGASTGRCDMG